MIMNSDSSVITYVYLAILCNLALLAWVIYLSYKIHILSIRLREVLENYIKTE